MRRRTRAREIALQFLYQQDLRGNEILETLDPFVRSEAEDETVRRFAERLIEGTLEHRAAFDERLRSVTRNWNINRMAVVDRNILRLALFELTYCPDIPPKVTINEAIELGKKYSTANSGAFINGILDRVRIDLQAEAQRAAGDPPQTLTQET
jgi:transcription antitermination factor NusB